jgi:hypothetical protein
MSWATPYIAKLKEGQTVSFRPRGHSMQGKISSGQLCTVEPLRDVVPKVGEVVLCVVRGNQYLHLVKAVQGERYQIGNNRGGINGWVSIRQIFGRCTKVED